MLKWYSITSKVFGAGSENYCRQFSSVWGLKSIREKQALLYLLAKLCLERISFLQPWDVQRGASGVDPEEGH